MEMRAATVLCGLAGCFAPEPTSGILCAPPGSNPRCPADLSCVVRGGMQVCEADGCPLTSYASIVGAPSMYRFEVDPAMERDWMSAQADCQDDARGIHLVVFDGPDELTAIRSVFPVTGNWQAWAGYARDAGVSLDMWFEVTGDPFSPTDPLWEVAEPSAVPDEEVVRFEATLDLIDEGRDGLHPYVCECDGRSSRTFAF